MCNESTLATPTTSTPTTPPTGRWSLFHDWRNQLSWGRFCALVALVMAVVREFQGAPIPSVAMWLGVAVGNYAMSKWTEMICGRAPNAPQA